MSTDRSEGDGGPGDATGVIRRLPDDLANQIAAGEVVERPASVAKELVENAVDASSTRIRVDVEGGGIGLIRVSDDGVGMNAVDARLAVERHATSKIAKLDDLTTIQSYGFRGEALPSIASVSRFALRTRRRDDEAGTEVLVDGGAAPRLAPCGVAPGTTVEVRDLFFNVPARRKFLRSLATESAHVTEMAEAAALASPGRTIVLAREGRVVREWLRVASREARVVASFAEETLAPCRGERGPMRVEAFLSRPERARAAASALTLLVNGRVVRDRALLRAVAQAYGSVLDPMRYPLGVVYLDIEPSLIDVNVHPQKAEVRFADARAVGEALFKILAEELARAFGMPIATRTWNRSRAADAKEFPPTVLMTPKPPSVTPDDDEPTLPWSFSSGSFTSGNAPGSGMGTAGTSSTRAGQMGGGGAESANWPGSANTFANANAFERSAPSGGASAGAPDSAVADDHETFGAAQGAGFRQGASDEGGRGGIERLVVGTFGAASGASREAAPNEQRQELASGRPYPLFEATSVAARPSFSRLVFVAQVKQTYLVCEGVDGLYVLDQHAAAERVTFHRLRSAYSGREIATQALLFPVTVEVSPSDVSFVEEEQRAIAELGLDVRAVGPTTLAVHAMPRLLSRAKPEAIVRDLIAEVTRSGGRAFSNAVDLVLATMACHGSIRAGDRLSPVEATALLASLDQVDFAGHCPHGRPIVTRMGWDELERKVGRR